MSITNFNHGSSITYSRKGVYSISLIPKIMELMKESKLSASNNIYRTAQSHVFFSGLTGNIEKDIIILHERGKKDNFYTLKKLGEDLAAVYEKKVDIESRNHLDRQISIEEKMDALSMVGTNILGVLTLIRTGEITKYTNLKLAALYLGKLSEFDAKKSYNYREFLDKYFFGTFTGTPYMNALISARGLVRRDKKLVRTDISFESFCRENKEGEAFETCMSEIKAIEKSFGFSVEEVKDFIQSWEALSTNQKVNLIYEAIKSSDSDAFKGISFTKEMIEGAYDAITSGIKKAKDTLVLLSKSKLEPDIKRYTRELKRILVDDFIFQEMVRSIADETPEIQAEYSSKESIIEHNRKMMDDIVRKNYPIYQQKGAVYQDPFGLRATLNSEDLDEALNYPESIVSSTAVRKAFVIYIIGMALLNADSTYDYFVGPNAPRKRRKEDTFEYIALNFIDKEIDLILSGKLSEDIVEKIKKLTRNYFIDDATAEQMRRYKIFLNIVHRDLATTHAIYNAGYSWGSLNNEQIDQISQNVLSSVYPMLKEMNARRQFRVVNDSSPNERQRSTIITENLDAQALLSLIKKEIYNKNRIVELEIRSRNSSSGAEQVDISDIVRNLKMHLSSLSASISDTTSNIPNESTPLLAGVHRGFIRESDIRISESKITSKDLFLKWLINH
jgi:hypothetical protein